MDDIADTKWRNRAALEVWTHDAAGRIEVVCDADGRWSVTVSVPSEPTTWIVTSGPCDSVEEACVLVIERLGAAGQTVPELHARRL